MAHIKFLSSGSSPEWGYLARSPEALDASLLPKQRKSIPHAFVLDAISTLSPYTRPMFGCLAIYVKDKIVLILRDKPKSTTDNGVWLAATQEHHQSLRREFPNMRSIQVLGKRVTGWQVLPVDAPDFESAALRACELVLAGDPRIGKIPGARTSKSGSKATGRSSKQIKTSKKHGSTINFDSVRKIGLALPGVEEKQVAVQFDERLVKYDFGELDEISLAYAITIHKSQGSEFPAVVIPLATQHYMLLQSNLIYTGITRGKRLLVLIGRKRRCVLRSATTDRRGGIRVCLPTLDVTGGP